MTELAKQARMERQTVSYLERGVTTPRADTLAKLATALGVSIVEFFVDGAA